MKQHQDRKELETIVDFLDPHNKDINPLQRLIVQKFLKETTEDGKENVKVEAIITPDMINLILQKIQIELSLDIRDLLYELNRATGVSKWGSKLGTADGTKVEHKLSDAPLGSFESEQVTPSAESVEKCAESVEK